MLWKLWITVFEIIFYQFLVLLNYSEQDQESLPAPAPYCLCQAGLPSWSVTPLMNRTSPNILILCKVLFPGSLHPLAIGPFYAEKLDKLAPLW